MAQSESARANPNGEVVVDPEEQVPVNRLINHLSPYNTTATPLPDGTLMLGFCMQESGDWVIHQFIIGEPGQKVISDVLQSKSRLTIAGPEDIPSI